ncbi:MAG: flavodoxin family protein [Megasphaera massiliensis]
MNAIVVYSSQTGRTKQIAEAVVSGLPEGTPCVSVDECRKIFPAMTAFSSAFGAIKIRLIPKVRKL